jgi:hypothetical protein
VFLVSGSRLVSLRTCIDSGKQWSADFTTDSERKACVITSHIPFKSHIFEILKPMNLFCLER